MKEKSSLEVQTSFLITIFLITASHFRAGYLKQVVGLCTQIKHQIMASRAEGWSGQTALGTVRR